MLPHENPETVVDTLEAALLAALARRAKLAGVRARLVSETADNEFAIVEAKAKVKAVKKYLQERSKWLADRMRAQPNLEYSDLIATYPLAPPE
jgi:hypothetical protein